MQDKAEQRITNEWIAKAESILQDTYRRICRATGQAPAPGFPIKPSFDASEAEYFVRGIERGIFSIDDEGYVQSQVLPPPSNRGTQKRILQLFWRGSRGRFLFREGVCQVSTVAELTLKYGWPLDSIQMEPTFPEVPKLAWAVDIALRSADGRAVALCEVKRDDREMDRLLRGFRACCAAGAHDREECKSGKNHPKYALSSAVRPSYFLATSPGRAIQFKLRYNGLLSIEKVSCGLVHRKSTING